MSGLGSSIGFRGDGSHFFFFFFFFSIFFDFFLEVLEADSVTRRRVDCHTHLLS